MTTTSPSFTPDEQMTPDEYVASDGRVPSHKNADSAGRTNPTLQAEARGAVRECEDLRVTDMSRGLGIADVSVTYPAGPWGQPVHAVRNVNLTIGPGHIVALLGASGSGKSSLLRAVAGLEDVASGDVTWDGRSVVRTPVHQRGFGLMFQEGQLFAHRSVAGNVAYGLVSAGIPKVKRQAIVDEMLEMVGLPGYGNRPITTLSGGQAQRVALARALAPNPRLLLLDEPLSALDRALREQLAIDVRTIVKSGNTTAMYVTHDHDEAMTVADRVGIMDNGELIRIDTPAGLLTDPRYLEVASFMGFAPFLTPAQAHRLGLTALANRSDNQLDSFVALGQRAMTIVRAYTSLTNGEQIDNRGESDQVICGVVQQSRIHQGMRECDLTIDQFIDEKTGKPLIFQARAPIDAPVIKAGCTVDVLIDESCCANVFARNR
ncbi:ABC transporter ATP-binding protein [Actinomyces vulturis]|uniref:ABC transporter ATP-binding protein n=1 Tax=Actinomyces vulturis TaxID=1857645 RepID=UPI000A7B4937|nr:ABC transporter ATP-binding protein [Actinomyces vulturis]